MPSRFQHGVLATPNVGSELAGLWTNRLYFVDGDGGSDSNDGLSPGGAFASLGQAVATASRDDTIYVRARAVGVRYTEAITVPVTTHAGLSIIGTGNGKGNSVYQACSFRTTTNAIDSPVLTLNSSHANIENLHFWSRAGQTHGFGILARWNTPVGLALNIGSSIVNCTFSNDYEDNPAGAGVVQSAIRFDSTEGQLVEGCFFRDCRVGISVGSTQSASYSIIVKDNLFKGIASNIAADLMLSDTTGIEIVGNYFGHAVPTHAAGTMTKYIFCIGGTTVTGGVVNNFQGAAAVAFGTNNTANSLIAAGNFGLGGPWTS